MKKLMTILVVTLFIAVSCNSKDDNPKTDKDKLVGKWRPVKYVDECTGEGINTYFPDNCEANNRITFNADGTGSATDFYLNDADECVNDTMSLNWNFTNNKLVITLDGDVTESTYEITETTLKATETEVDGNTTCTYQSFLEKVN